MSRLLQERFASHELPVPEGLWENIAGQLSLAQNQGLAELLQDRFSSHEMDVDPGVWEGISQSLGQATVGGAAAGTSVMTWLAAGLGTAALVGGVLWLVQPTAETIADQEFVSLNEVVEKPMEPARAGQIGSEEQTGGVAPKEEVTSTRSQGNPAGREQGEPPVQPTDALPEPQATADRAGSGASEPVEAADAGMPNGEAVVARLVGQMTSEVDKNPIVAQDPHDPKVVETTSEEPAVLPAVPVEEVPEIQIYLPNVFTPNGDGINDEYEPQGVGVDRVKIRVYSLLNNELVFVSDGLKAWNGSDLRGTPCPAGHYIYAIEVIGPDGQVHSKGQTVLLIR